MTLATILREAEIPTENFEKVAQIPITLFDGKDRKITDEDVHFAEPLFKNHQAARKQVQTFLALLQNYPLDEHMNVKIDEYSVSLFYKNPHCRIFLRKPYNPMDFMG